jgi:hypothetical protein
MTNMSTLDFHICHRMVVELSGDIGHCGILASGEHANAGNQDHTWRNLATDTLQIREVRLTDSTWTFPEWASAFPLLYSSLLEESQGRIHRFNSASPATDSLAHMARFCPL